MGQIPDPQELLTAQFPTKTAGELTLPNGSVVWIQTLNSLHREDCETRANRDASLECVDLAPGGKMRQAVVASVRAKTAEEQADILTSNQFRDGSMAREVNEKFPVLPRPDKIENEDEAGWLGRFQTWESEVAEREKGRFAYEEELWEAERAKALALTAKERVDRCVRSYVSEQWVRAFIRSVRVEQLYRATRRADDHGQRFFTGVEEIEDLDDPSLQALLDFYDGLQVNHDAIPT